MRLTTEKISSGGGMHCAAKCVRASQDWIAIGASSLAFDGVQHFSHLLAAGSALQVGVRFEHDLEQAKLGTNPTHIGICVLREGLFQISRIMTSKPYARL
eukprot:2291065-Amphidinium_carterae.1